MNREFITTVSAARERLEETLIVALDLPTQDEAMALVDRLDGRVRYVKIGHRLFSKYGPAILEECAARGVEVFLDLKLYDIPSVVKEACAHIADHKSVFMTTVHASGGAEMMRAAMEGIGTGGDDARPHVVAVTALTSFSQQELPALGVDSTIQEWVTTLASLAIDSGVDGLVSSTQEVPNLRREHGDEPILVTPGIRLSDGNVDSDDQHRVDTPAGALRAGSTMLVMGRPIYQADDPLAVLDRIAQSFLEQTPGGEQS